MNSLIYLIYLGDGESTVRFESPLDVSLNRSKGIWKNLNYAHHIDIGKDLLNGEVFPEPGDTVGVYNRHNDRDICRMVETSQVLREQSLIGSF